MGLFPGSPTFYLICFEAEILRYVTEQLSLSNLVLLFVDYRLLYYVLFA
jgi:hypothetical protein